LSKGPGLRTVRASVSTSEDGGTDPSETPWKEVSLLAVNLSNYVRRLLQELAKTNPENAITIYKYIRAEQIEINIRESTKENKIKNLCWLSKHLRHMSFQHMKKEDILSYLNRMKKPESDDRDHRSVGTHNSRQMVLLKFFR
jgi:hypothetical protein